MSGPGPADDTAVTAASEGDRPTFSVVIASVNGLPYPLTCLEALAAQDADVSYEVVLADCTGPATAAAIRERFPDTVILEYDEQKSVPWLRAQGVAAARGRYVCVTEDHCVPHPDWFSRFLDAFDRTNWAAVGGGVVNECTERVIDWTVFFCEYSGLIDPVETGPSRSVPGMNVAYDMDRLKDLADVFAAGTWENFLHDELIARGFELGLDASVVVGHRKHFTVGMFTSERFHYSRSFAGMRVTGAGIGPRLTWAAKSLLLPPILVWRIWSNVSRKPTYRSPFLRSLPLILYFSVIWSVGELVGYLAGPGDSLVRVK